MISFDIHLRLFSASNAVSISRRSRPREIVRNVNEINTPSTLPVARLHSVRLELTCHVSPTVEGAPSESTDFEGGLRHSSHSKRYQNSDTYLWTNRGCRLQEDAVAAPTPAQHAESADILARSVGYALRSLVAGSRFQLPDSMRKISKGFSTDLLSVFPAVFSPAYLAGISQRARLITSLSRSLAAFDSRRVVAQSTRQVPHPRSPVLTPVKGAKATTDHIEKPHTMFETQLWSAMRGKCVHPRFRLSQMPLTVAPRESRIIEPTQQEEYPPYSRAALHVLPKAAEHENENDMPWDDIWSSRNSIVEPAETANASHSAMADTESSWWCQTEQELHKSSVELCGKKLCAGFTSDHMLLDQSAEWLQYRDAGTVSSQDSETSTKSNTLSNKLSLSEVVSASMLFDEQLNVIGFDRQLSQTCGTHPFEPYPPTGRLDAQHDEMLYVEYARSDTTTGSSTLYCQDFSPNPDNVPQTPKDLFGVQCPSRHNSTSKDPHERHTFFDPDLDLDPLNLPRELPHKDISRIGNFADTPDLFDLSVASVRSSSRRSSIFGIRRMSTSDSQNEGPVSPSALQPSTKDRARCPLEAQIDSGYPKRRGSLLKRLSRSSSKGSRAAHGQDDMDFELSIDTHRDIELKRRKTLDDYAMLDDAEEDEMLFA